MFLGHTKLFIKRNVRKVVRSWSNNVRTSLDGHFCKTVSIRLCGLSDANICRKKVFIVPFVRYGQMTAGSYCYIGPQGIVHGTTVSCAIYVALAFNLLRGKVVVCFHLISIVFRVLLDYCYECGQKTGILRSCWKS